MAIVRSGDLDIDVDMVFQQRSWAVQRAGWIVIGLLVLAAAAGLLGSGPLSRRTATVPGVLEIEYARFTRYEDPERLSVRLLSAATVNPSVQLSLNREYLDHSRIDSITPAPERVESAGRHVVYAFRVAEPGQPLEVTFNIAPQRVGGVEGRVRVDPVRGPELRFHQFAYP
jgi:hypothetical protein